MYVCSGVYVEKDEEIGVQLPFLINGYDSSHQLPTHATLGTALMDKWAQLERPGVL